MKWKPEVVVGVVFLAGWRGVGIRLNGQLAELFPGDFGDLYVQSGFPGGHQG
jgi:hypothetical protein